MSAGCRRKKGWRARALSERLLSPASITASSSSATDRCEPSSKSSGLGAVFTGTLQPDQVAVAMASADLFVFPSRTDTAGNVVLEAQASGLPVLVTDSGGPRENMLDGQTGYVCGDWRAFARRIGSLAWNPEHRARLADAARRYALGRRWDLALEPLYRSYREAAAPVAFSDRLHARPAVAR